jgi:Flp pilus assembly protein TadD
MPRRLGCVRQSWLWATSSLFFVACAGSAPLPAKAVELNRTGIEALTAGDLETADARFTLALEYSPTFVDALTNQGLVELQRGNFERGRQLLERARRLNPDLPQPHHGLGVLEEREGRPDRASRHYYEALRVDPGFVPARANLARLLYDSGYLEEALVQFKRLSEVAPTDASGYVGLATTLLRLERRDEASDVIAEGRRAAPESKELTILEAREAIHAGHWQEATILLSPLAAERDDLAVAALGWLAVTELAQDHARAAIGAAKRALELAPDDPVSTLALGQALLRLGDPNAQAWLERAQKLAPGARLALHSAP